MYDIRLDNDKYRFVFDKGKLDCYRYGAPWIMDWQTRTNAVVSLLDIAEKHDRTIKYIDTAIKGLEESDDAPVAFSREDVVAMLLLVRYEMVSG